MFTFKCLKNWSIYIILIFPFNNLTFEKKKIHVYFNKLNLIMIFSTKDVWKPNNNTITCAIQFTN